MKTTWPNSPIFVHVAYGPGLVPLCGLCDMFCTSGFVDDVMFSHNSYIARHVYSFLSGDTSITAEIQAKFLLWMKTENSHCIGLSCAPGVKSVI